MSARVGRSGFEGKPAVETKPREAVLSLSLSTWAKAMANPVSQSCPQPRNVGLFGTPRRFPMTSACVSAYFRACSCPWRSSIAASRRRSSSARVTVLAITSRTIQESAGVVNDESDTGWIRAKHCFDRTVEWICRCGSGLVEARLRTVGSTSLPGLRNNLLCTWAVGTGVLGAGTRDGEFHFK